MYKNELINSVAEKTKMSKVKTAEIVSAVLSSIIEPLSKGESVILIGFGTFSVAHRKERNGRDPNNGKIIKIPAKNVVKFSPSKSLKEIVNSEALKEMFNSKKSKEIADNKQTKKSTSSKKSKETVNGKKSKKTANKK